MSIKIRKVAEGLYSATVMPPNGASLAPMHYSDLFQALRDLDCHVVDIVEAFLAADPEVGTPKSIERVRRENMESGRHATAQRRSKSDES